MDQPAFDDLIEDALDAVSRNDNVRAVSIADQLAAMAPGDPVVRAIRAQALLQSDAGVEAFEEARRAVALDPESQHAHTILGIAAWRAGRLSVAQQSLEKAIELSGRKPGLLIDYAWFMAAERGPRLAEKAAQRAVRAAPASSTAWAALGLAQFRLHRRPEAEASLKHALELDANDPYAQSAMVSLLQEKRQDRQAVALAHLLEDVPGTEELVDSVRRVAKRREVAKKLVERGVDTEAGIDRTRRQVVWLAISAVAIPVACIVVWPTTIQSFLICVGVTAVVLLVLRWIFG